MNAQELQSVLAEGEDITAEFKRCGAQPEKDTFETICSFANRQGGSIFLGVDDDGSIVGINQEHVRSIERNIVNVINNPNVFNAPPIIEFERISTDVGLVLKVWVPLGPSVYSFKNVVYDRRGDVDVKVRDDGQLSMMYLRKRNMYTERRIFPYITIDDFDKRIIERTRELVAAHNANHPWLDLDDNSFFRASKLYGRNRESGATGFTLAAVLLLGGDDLISDVCPAYKTDAIVRLRNTDRFDDRIIVSTNLVDAYESLMGFAQRNLPDPFVMDGGVSVSVRDVICRELISNMLIHREFTSPFVAKLVIDDEGIHTENASRAMFEGELTLDNFNPTPKNPIIADFFQQIGRAEELGSGTRNLMKYSYLYSGERPSLYDGDVFTALVPVPWNTLRTDSRLTGHEIDDVRRMNDEDGDDGKTQRQKHEEDVARAVKILLGRQGYVTTAQIAEAADISVRTARRYLKEMVNQGRLTIEGAYRDRRYMANRKTEI